MNIPKIRSGFSKTDKTASTGSEVASSVNALIDVNNQTEGVWLRLPAIYKLIFTGVGTVVFSTRDISENLLQEITYTVDGYREEFPFFTDAYEFMTAYTGTAIVEVV
jgi:hypothetical protein